MTESQSFPARAGSIPAARRFAASVLASIPSEVREIVVLLVSELVTNCIRHAASDVNLSIDLDIERDQLRVEVTDSGGGQPTLRTPGPEEPTGRGLQIVAALSSDWGVSPAATGSGKTVWFTYRLPAAAAAEEVASPRSDPAGLPGGPQQASSSQIPNPAPTPAPAFDRGATELCLLGVG